jgi:hypothetical protein
MIIPILRPGRAVPAAILTAGLAFVPLACNRHKPVVVQTEEEGPILATIVHVADPRTAAQLLSGFYGVEQNSWRWTAGKFSVVLRPPRTAAAKGATLQLKFSVPQVVIAKLKAMSLSATVNGSPLSPESYTLPGEFTYTRDVPANLLVGDSAKVDFSLDKTMPPSASDQRELGIVASTVGLEPK